MFALVSHFCRSALITACLLGAVACDSRDPFDLDLDSKFQTTWVEYESDAPVQFSPTLGDTLAEAAAAMQTDFDVAAELPPLRYSVVTSVSAENPCRIGERPVPACAGSDHIVTGDPFHLHELAHVVARPLGRPPSAIEEGLAEIYGCSLWSAPLATRDLTFDEVLDSELFLDSGSYAAAASFVAHITRERGVPAFMRFYAEAGRGDPVAIEEAARAHLGLSLREAFDAWQASSIESEPSPCRDVYLCARSHEALGSGEVELVRGLLTGRASHAGAIRTLELDAPSTLSLGVAAAVLPRVSIVSCSDGARIGTYESATRSLRVEASLPAGRYALLLASAITSSADAEATITTDVVVR